MTKIKSIWSCLQCGQKQAKWSGNCSACQAWNSFVKGGLGGPSSFGSQPIQLHEIEEDRSERIPTGFSQYDKLLGGGFVLGSLSLLAGDPGIGKSTLMLQVASHLSKCGIRLLYVCGEESVEQTALRARRLHVHAENLFFFSETNFEHIENQVQKLNPQVLIIDSIQILYKAGIPSNPGSITQVRELAVSFMHLAKKKGICTLLISHVTKSGDIAGPKTVEHIVDTVIEFEGNRSEGHRLLRTIKNRFGPTGDLVLFQMSSEGLKEVENPSSLFLRERVIKSVGSVIVPTLEGSRPLLVEVQALVATSAFATSARRCTGLDPNRLALLLAVLEKRMGYTLHRNDIFVAVAGGLKIVEPGIDLPVLIAVASSFCNRVVDVDAVVMGEVGLLGEVRNISGVEQRIKEAINMGFKRCFLPYHNLKGLEFIKEIDLIGVTQVEEVIEHIFTL